MLGLNPLAWVALAIFLLGAGAGTVKWLRADAVADRDQEITVETTKLQTQEQLRAADNSAQSEREALVAEAEDAERERQMVLQSQKIAELEARNAKCGTVSRDTVRALNSSR